MTPAFFASLVGEANISTNSNPCPDVRHVRAGGQQEHRGDAGEAGQGPCGHGGAARLVILTFRSISKRMLPFLNSGARF